MRLSILSSLQFMFSKSVGRHWVVLQIQNYYDKPKMMSANTADDRQKWGTSQIDQHDA